MAFLLLIPVVLSFLLLGAHFLFHQSLGLFCLSLVFPLVLLARRRWVPWLVEAVLLLGAIEWLATLLLLIQQRQQEGAPWQSGAIILGSVLIFTAASGLVFAAPRLRKFYGRRYDLLPNF